MAREKISAANYNELHQDLRDAKEELSEAQARVEEVQEFEVVEDCPKCKGIGKVEDGHGDPAHNPYGDMLYKNCPDCKGKGYIDE